MDLLTLVMSPEQYDHLEIVVENETLILKISNRRVVSAPLNSSRSMKRQVVSGLVLLTVGEGTILFGDVLAVSNGHGIMVLTNQSLTTSQETFTESVTIATTAGTPLMTLDTTGIYLPMRLTSLEGWDHQNEKKQS
jgi:hypothetical protein